jgi:hypothetical protein
VAIKFTILTIVDPTTGAKMWSDSREWGSWRVGSATTDLIAELRQQIEGQTKQWKLNDILMCSVTPVYAGFAHLTAEEAIARSKEGAENVLAEGDRLQLKSLDAPDFCKSADFVLNADNRIIGFEVLLSGTGDLNFNEVLQRADQFDFTSGKDPRTNRVYLLAQSKDRKLRIRFDIEGRRSLLSTVSYFYH